MSHSPTSTIAQVARLLQAGTTVDFRARPEARWTRPGLVGALPELLTHGVSSGGSVAPAEMTAVFASLGEHETEQVLGALAPSAAAAVARVLLTDALSRRPALTIPVTSWSDAWKTAIALCADRDRPIDGLTGDAWREIQGDDSVPDGQSHLNRQWRTAITKPGMREAATLLHHPLGRVVRDLDPAAWNEFVATLSCADVVRLVPHVSDAQIPELLHRLSPAPDTGRPLHPLVEAWSGGCDAGDFTLLAARISGVKGADARWAALEALVDGQRSLDMFVFAHQLPADVLRALVADIPPESLRALILRQQEGLWRAALAGGGLDAVGLNPHSEGISVLIAAALHAPTEGDRMPPRPVDVGATPPDARMGQVLPLVRVLRETLSSWWHGRGPVDGGAPDVNVILIDQLDRLTREFRGMSPPPLKFGGLDLS